MEEKLLERLYREHHHKGKRLRQSFIEQKRAKLFSSWIGERKRILDLGCRDGTLTRHFIKGNIVIGADIDSDALSFAHREYGIEVHKVDLNSVLPFEDKSFDIVLLAETLEHLPYPSVTLKEIQRVLKVDGKFTGNVPLFYHLQNRFRVLRGKLLDYDPTHCKYYSYDSLKEMLNLYFTVEEIIPLKGEKFARWSMRLFARNVAFLCKKN